MSDIPPYLHDASISPIAQQMFAHWCVWEQARPALGVILEQVELHDIAERIRKANDLFSIIRIGESATKFIKELRKQTGPLGLSAAEAATFEFASLARAANESDLDLEAVSFFSARICGWAGWAVTGFRNPQEKLRAEQDARTQQVEQIKSLRDLHP